VNRKNQIDLLCHFLKTWRKTRRISQELVKQSTGIDVSNYELHRCEPGLYNILILCDYYGISPIWLLQIVADVDSGTMSTEELVKKAQGNVTRDT
jgi:transcriptional regulator with XRE-family HTH domain